MGFHRRNLFIPVLFIILLIGTSAISQVAASDDQADPFNASRVFEEWMVKYKRVYKSKEEKEKRFAIFKTAFKGMKRSLHKYDDQEDPFNASQVFEEWMRKYKRVYKSMEEKEKRFAIFKTAFKGLKRRHDWREYKSFIAHLHKFSDMTMDEISMGCHNPEDLRPPVHPVHDLRRNPHGLP
ncbi:fruit bromelain-like [Rosa rugosa]|uniref:fruit bromelain-like n=1 Tax=Rosa rugosa TaxID=74645 RepID=UPI002B418035|nr:fruit bromelain-like [Rosa rugosa]